MEKVNSKQVFEALRKIMEIPNHVTKLTLCISVGEPVVATVEYFPKSIESEKKWTVTTTSGTVASASVTHNITPPPDDNIPPVGAIFV